MGESEAEESAVEGEFVQEIAYLVSDLETTCSICQAEFLDFEDLNIHVKQVHEGSGSCLNICQFCEETYADLDAYACHIRDVHFFELKCCRFCSKCFTDQRMFRKHERKHYSATGMFACSQCTGLFTTRKELHLHEVVNHDNTSDGVILSCMAHLSGLLKLKVVIYLQSEEKVLQCQSCDFLSLDAHSYFQHLKNNTCSVYVCDKCGSVYKNKKYLQKHFHRNNWCMDSKEYTSGLTECPYCKKEVLGQQMKTHLKYCKVYKCETCDIRFDTILDLSSHQSEIHPLDLEVIKCNFCTREYVGSTSLEKHVDRAHRPMFILYKYACKECGAIFKHPQKLFAHYFTKHRDLEPYTCRICDKKFRIRKNFTIHIKLEHKSLGVVEFDDQYHVFFAEKKSENPFIPTCVVPDLLANGDSNQTEKVVIKKVVGKGKKKMQDSDDENFSDTIVTGHDSTTEVESDAKKPQKSYTGTTKAKKKTLKRSKKTRTLSTSDEEEEPLVMIKKKAIRKRFHKLLSPGTYRGKQNSINRKQFTCKDCNKYCYTYQNYHNHIKTHKKNESIQCIKCSRSFKTKNELTEHVTTDHATSRLIETLKSVLERKQGETQNVPDTRELTTSERFSRTFVKVKADKSNTPAKIGPPSNPSVRNFIENFVPDVSEQKEIKLDPVVSIKHYASPFYRKRCITLTKFTPETHVENVTLKMPQKFKEENTERIKISVKLVQQAVKQLIFESDDNAPTQEENGDNFQDYDDYEDYKHDGIPEVAEEVMLEGTEEVPEDKQQSPKIVIPQLPKGYPSIHIATWQPEAPFYKIIKVKATKDNSTIITTPIKKEKTKPSSTLGEIINMPDGTKFVTANPLAHLLGNKTVEEVTEVNKYKYYTPVRTDYKGLLVDAMQNIGKRTSRKRKKVDSPQVTQELVTDTTSEVKEPKNPKIMDLPLIATDSTN